MTTESATSAPSISVEHIHATLLSEINALMEKIKTAKTADHAMIYQLQAMALGDVYSQLITPVRNSVDFDVFEHIKQVGQLTAATIIKSEAAA